MKNSFLAAACAVLLALPLVAQHPENPTPIPATPQNPPVKNVDPNGPRIGSPRTSFDFGEAPQNDKVEYDFIVENRGKAPLENIKANPTCSCTVAQPEKSRLEPGESTKIHITFNTQQFNGPVTKTIVVESTDPTQPRFNLTLSGRVTQAFHANVTEVNFGVLRKGTKFPDATFDVLTASSLAATVLDIQSDVSAVKAKFDRLPADSPAKGYRVTVSIDGAVDVGQLRGVLTVITDLASQKQFTIPFVAQIDGEISVTPRQFTFGTIKAGDTAAKEIRITKTGDSPLKIESLQMKSGGLFNAELVEVKAGREYVVKVTPAPGIKAGYQRETLTINTNVKGEEKILAYFYAIVK